jgi:transposase
MGMKGLKAPFRVKGNVDGEMVEKYFREHLVKELETGQIVVLDNASYHKRKGIQRVIEEAGCKLLFLPAYSPDFNPIEQLWSQLKRLVKKSVRQVRKSVSEAIDWAFLQIMNCPS